MIQKSSIIYENTPPSPSPIENRNPIHITTDWVSLKKTGVIMVTCNYCKKEHDSLESVEGLTVYNHPLYDQGEHLYFCTSCIKAATDELRKSIPLIKKIRTGIA